MTYVPGYQKRFAFRGLGEDPAEPKESTVIRLLGKVIPMPPLAGSTIGAQIADGVDRMRVVLELAGIDTEALSVDDPPAVIDQATSVIAQNPDGVMNAIATASTAESAFSTIQTGLNMPFQWTQKDILAVSAHAWKEIEAWAHIYTNGAAEAAIAAGAFSVDELATDAARRRDVLRLLLGLDQLGLLHPPSTSTAGLGFWVELAALPVSTLIIISLALVAVILGIVFLFLYFRNEREKFEKNCGPDSPLSPEDQAKWCTKKDENSPAALVNSALIAAVVVAGIYIGVVYGIPAFAKTRTA